MLYFDEDNDQVLINSQNELRESFKVSISVYVEIANYAKFLVIETSEHSLLYSIVLCIRSQIGALYGGAVNLL